MRLATWGAGLSRDGPGLLLRDILKGDDAQIGAALGVIADTAPDILLLTDTDADPSGTTLDALADALAAEGVRYPYRLAIPGNTGVPTSFDMDGDGKLGTPRDAQGYGRFRGDGAMALLSRWPIDPATRQDFSTLPWQALTAARLPTYPDGAPFPEANARAAQRLSSVAHSVVEVTLPTGQRLSLLVYAATPPVFDGPEDRNGLRSADESALWLAYLNGTIGAPPRPHFALLGRANIDPVDGEGLHEAMEELLTHPKIQDPRPSSAGGAGAADAEHRGDPALDTAEWRGASEGGPGNLRVDYVLPSKSLTVRAAGVHWPDGPAQQVRAASRHRLVWVDVIMPRGSAQPNDDP